jgi:hypothetical protein
MRRLLTVEESFDITNRGLLVVPGPLETEYNGPRQFDVRLKLPSGDEKTASLTLEHIFQSPPPKEIRWACVLKGVSKSDVPIGTEVWTESD